MLAKQDHRIEQVISKPKWGVKITKQSHPFPETIPGPTEHQAQGEAGDKPGQGDLEAREACPPVHIDTGCVNTSETGVTKRSQGRSPHI